MIAAHFDGTDRREFKELCEDVLCFWGDVPGSLMVTGTPAEVRAYVKVLIDDFGETGGLTIDGASSITDEARPGLSATAGRSRQGTRRRR